MNEEEKKAIEDIKRTIELYELKPIDRISVEFDEFDYKIFKTILNLIEKQQNRIDELEKALIDEDFKYRNKIDKLKSKLKEDKEKMQSYYDDNEMNYYKQIDYILEMLEG